MVLGGMCYLEVDWLQTSERTLHHDELKAWKTCSVGDIQVALVVNPFALHYCAHPPGVAAHMVDLYDILAFHDLGLKC